MPYAGQWFAPAPVRRAEIDRLAGAANGRSFPVALSGGYVDLPVAAVPHRLLAYRIGNGRLVAELPRAFADAGLAADAGGESVAEQGILHALLLAHATDPQGPILPELERARRQTEPLIATRDGFVVNGNRRLAAMRELHGRGDGPARPFATVDVAFLPPDTGEAEIEYLEASLQMAPETKLGYGWPNRRLKLRHQRDVLRLPVRRMIDAYRLEGPEQLEREIGELVLAEDFLSWSGEAGAWERLDGGWELVEALNARLRALDGDLRSIWRVTGFLLLRHRGATDPRAIYPFAAPFSSLHPRLAAERVARLAGLVEGESPGDRGLRDALVPFASQGDAARAREIVDVLATMRQEHQEQVAPMRALSQLRQTGAMLQRLEPGRLSQPQRRQLRSDLAALSAQAGYLLGELDAPEKDLGASWNARKGLFDPPLRKVLPRLWKRMSGG